MKDGKGEFDVTEMARAVDKFLFAGRTRTNLVRHAEAGIQTTAVRGFATGHAEELLVGDLEFCEALHFFGTENAELEMGDAFGSAVAAVEAFVAGARAVVAVVVSDAVGHGECVSVRVTVDLSLYVCRYLSSSVVGGPMSEARLVGMSVDRLSVGFEVILSSDERTDRRLSIYLYHM